MYEIFGQSEHALCLSYVKNNTFYILVNVIVDSCCLCRIPLPLLGHLFSNLILELVSVCHLQKTPVSWFASFSDIMLLQLDFHDTNTKLTIATMAFFASTKYTSFLPPIECSNSSLLFFSCLLLLRFTDFFSGFIPFCKDAKLELTLLLV